MNGEGGPYAGQDRLDAARRDLERLEEDGLLARVEPYSHSVGHCQRCGTIVEPRVSTQWFVKIKPLADPAIARGAGRRIRFVPERFSEGLLQLDGEHPRLVHLAAAVVGPPYSGVVLPGLRAQTRRP